MRKFFFFFLAQIFIFFALTANAVKKNSLSIKNNFSKPISLSGEWNFYPNKIISPKDFLDNKVEIDPIKIKITTPWSHQGLRRNGFGTYTLEVKGASDTLFYFNTPRANSASSIFLIDGKRIVSIVRNGIVGKNAREEVPGFKKSSEKVFPRSNKILFVVQISNFHYQNGGFKSPPSISKTSHFSSEIYSSALIFGVLLVMTCFYFGLFLQGRDKKSSLYFGIMLFALCAWKTSDGHIWIFLDWNKYLWSFLNKLEHSALIIGPLAYSYFLRERFPQSNFFKSSVKFGNYISLFLLAIITFFPSTFFTKEIILIPIKFFLVLSCFSFVIGLAKICKEEKIAQYLLLVLFFPIIAFGMNNLENLGLTVWIIGQSYIFSRNFSNRYDDLEKLSKNLKKDLNLNTRNLENERDKVSNILKSVNEAIFSIDYEGIIKEGTISKSTKNIFDQDMVGKSVYETLFASIPRNTETFIKIQSGISTSIGTTLSHWEIWKDDMPKIVKYKSPVDDKFLSINYEGILTNDNKEVKEIILSVGDITEKEKLKVERSKERKRNIIISELAPERGRDLEKYKNNLEHFFEQSRNLISEASSVASAKSLDEINKWDEQLIWKNIHKVKGNSRLFGLKGLSSKLHEQESKFLDFKRGKKRMSDDIILEICSSLLATIEILSDYESTAKDIFGIGTQTTKLKETKHIEVKKLEIMDEKILNLSKKLDLPEIKDLKNEWDNLLQSSTTDLFSGFESLIESISRELGKEVAYRVGGDDVHLDRKKFSKILDALTHILRNCIDHGIELPTERLLNDKPKKGNIDINCFKENSNLKLIVKDDGRGIDGELIAKKALEKKIISKEEHESMIESEKIDLIFRPGFSSKDEATEISGRGIGMDIVKSNVEGLGGKIEVKTKKGEGSDFIITLPIKTS